MSKSCWRTALVVLTLAGGLRSQDPRTSEVSLGELAGWNATLVHQADVGIWTVRSLDLLPLYGAHEVIGLDDKGRLTVAVPYSGKWTPLPTVEDGAWLGALAHVDLDPRIPGPEIYTGGKSGNLYQIVPNPGPPFDVRRISRHPGLELHTCADGDLLPERPGNELLVFTHDGQVFDVQPRGAGFEAPLLTTLTGRVRDVLTLPGKDRKRIVAALRSGHVSMLTWTPEGLQSRDLHTRAMGFGRLARAPIGPGHGEVVYAGCDDGLLVRLEEQDDGSWTAESIYAGPQGIRGVAAGRFDRDPDVETVAIFGYSKRVQMLSRREGRWSAETIFVDTAAGHWLAAAELDGRNATDELIGSGYGQRIFQLARPPGYGRPGLTTDPDARPAPDEAKRPARLAMRAGPSAATRLSSLAYRGGFEMKTWIFETLVRRDDEGRIVPALASEVRIEDEGRRHVLTLRPNARFHDGTPVTASAVALHFRRALGLPEHDWLLLSRRRARVSARGDREIVIETDAPQAVLPELCVVNPMAIMAPSSFDPEGEFLGPIGSGPFRWVGVTDSDRRLRLSSVADGRLLDIVRVESSEPCPLDALLSGSLDGIVDGWSERIPRERVAELAKDERLEVHITRGSLLIYVSMSLTGPTADRDLRRYLAATLDRAAFVAAVDSGHGVPTDRFSRLAVWPTSEKVREVAPERPKLAAPLRILLPSGGARLRAASEELLRQILALGLPAVLVSDDGVAQGDALRGGRFDLRIETTWGSPYDPDVSLTGRFLLEKTARSASSVDPVGVDPRVSALVAKASLAAEPEARAAVHSEIQRLFSEEVVIIPLYVPDRIGVWHRARGHLRFGTDLYRIDASEFR